MILRVLAERLGCSLRGDGETEVRRVAGIEGAGPGDLTFVANSRYLARLATTRASAVIVAPGVETALPSLLSENPYLAFARAVGLLHPQPKPEPGVHPSAQVHASARLGEGVHVGALAVVGADVTLGARSAIHPHVVLYPGVEIGEDCVLHSGVQVRDRCRLGRRVVVQNGSVIGGDGFGFARGADTTRRSRRSGSWSSRRRRDQALVAIDRAALEDASAGAR
jgi:UDP-3-O-[3-hydroxymyristoyl] glucosamine N-acyltransferase